MTMSDPELIQGVFSLAAIALSFVLLLRSRTRRFRRKLARHKLRRLGDLPEGTYARIVGRAHPAGEPLIAPMTGRRCVYYEVKVEGKGIAPHPGKMTVIAAETKAIPFLLVDGTGRALVDPEGADVLIDFDARSDFSPQARVVTPEHLTFFERHGRKVIGGVYGTELRYREAVIEVEDMITILGAGIREPDPDPVSAGPRSRMRFATTPQHPLMITDDWSPDEKPHGR
jgi:hypothetical protein